MAKQKGRPMQVFASAGHWRQRQAKQDAPPSSSPASESPALHSLMSEPVTDIAAVFLQDMPASEGVEPPPLPSVVGVTLPPAPVPASAPGVGVSSPPPQP